jgi:predicted dehydrogenase
VKGSQVLAISSRSLDKAKETARKLGIPRAYGSYDELLADPEIDVVYIPLPNHMHCEWTIKAAKAGKHVLCEKPMALNEAEGKRMIAACEKNRVVLMEAFMYRFHPQWKWVFETIKSGRIGKPRVIVANFSFCTDRPKTDYRMNPAMGGGALMDVGCYCVNSSRTCFGAEPIRVSARSRYDKELGIDLTTAGIIEFPDDRSAIFECSFDIEGRWGVTIQGPRGYISVTDPWLPRNRKPKIEFLCGGKKSVIHAPAADQYTLEATHMAECILKGKKPLYPPTDALANIKVLKAIEKSAKTGKTIKL